MSKCLGCGLVGRASDLGSPARGVGGRVAVLAEDTCGGAVFFRTAGCVRPWALGFRWGMPWNSTYGSCGAEG